MENIKVKIETLRAELHQHNYNYYVLSQPTISDYDFDMKLSELAALEKKYPEYADMNSPTQRVGSDVNKSFRQVTHKYPMLSLGNTYSKDDVQDFIKRVQRMLGDNDVELVCELKFDGTSISLTYEDGRLVQAVTRGDGEKGDDVTDNVRTIRSIPLQLSPGDYPRVFEMRGEILMPWKVFERLNKEREEQEEPLFANPRNAASGTLKLQNSSETARRQLDSYLYFILGEGIKAETHYELLQKAKNWGFKISDAVRIARNVEEVFDYINYWDIERKNLPVATDGVVLKVNSLRQQQELGLTAKSPRWAIAYKFKAERECTKLENVSYQVGRTGKITPVANLMPVQLAGTIVKRASLHNSDIIKELDLREGDMVYVEKGGEIIPKIVGVDKEARNELKPEIGFVDSCPECGTKLVRVDGEAAHYCPNEDGCPPQQKGKIVHFVSRKAMNINLGEESVDLFYDNGLIHNIGDIYDLDILTVSFLPKWGAKSAKKLFESIEASKSVPFERVLFALGIRTIGEASAKTLVKELRTIDNIMNASIENLTKINDVGEITAVNIREYFSKQSNLEIVERLRKAGLKMEIEESNVPTSEKLKGLSIVISGTFENHSREELKNLIEQNGGKNASSVSKNTDYLLTGFNIGPAKLEKAKALEVKMISEKEFMKLIELKE